MESKATIQTPEEQGGKRPPARKPYQKPDVTYRGTLEAVAAACSGGTPKSSTGGPGFCTNLFS